MIHVLWPTARPTVASRQAHLWGAAAARQNHLRFTAAVDTDEQLAELKDFPGAKVKAPPGRPGVCRPATHLTTTLVADPKDVVVLASDDFLPARRWDVFLTTLLRQRDMAVVVNDGTLVTKPIVALPIMSAGVLAMLNGIIYHPAYNHLYSDQELYYNLRELKLLWDVRRSHSAMMFEHRHPGRRKRTADEIDARNQSLRDEDAATFARRTRLPLWRRLLSSEGSGPYGIVHHADAQ